MIKKVRSGQAIKPRPLNDVIDLVNLRKLETGNPFPKIKQAGTQALAVNKTGSDLLFGMIAAVDLDAPIPAGFDDSVHKLESLGTTLILREPGSTDLHNYVVCATAMPDGQSGIVYTEGIILARLNEAVGSGDDQSNFVDADPDAYTNGGNVFAFSKRYDGSARIIKDLGPSEEAGVNWALVQYPVWNDNFARFAKATSGVTDGILTVKLADSQGNLVGEDITVYSGGM